MRLFLPTLFDETAAIKLSQAKKYTKMWRTSGASKIWEPLFRKFSADKRAYRIYLPIQAGPVKTPKRIIPPNDVVQALAKLGYTIDDYVAGIAISKDQTRRVRIGKLIANDAEALKSFSNDKRRKTHINDSQAEQNLVVISRHPVDLAGMSTGRGWTSCMNLDTGINRRYVAVDVKLGTLVAYYIKADDTNVSSPIGRVLIKPMKSTKKGDRRLYLVREDTHYGTVTPAFLKTIDAWVAKVNADVGTGTFKLPSSLYNDAISEDTVHVVSFADMETPKDASAFLKYASRPTDAQRAAAVALLDTDVREVVDFLHWDDSAKPVFPRTRAWALDTVRKADAKSAILGEPHRDSDLSRALMVLQRMRVVAPPTKYVVTPGTPAQVLRMMADKKDYSTLLAALLQEPLESLPSRPSDLKALRSLCVVLLKRAMRAKKRDEDLEAFLESGGLIAGDDLTLAVQQYASKLPLRTAWSPVGDALVVAPNEAVTPYLTRLNRGDLDVVVRDFLTGRSYDPLALLRVFPKEAHATLIEDLLVPDAVTGPWMNKLSDFDLDLWIKYAVADAQYSGSVLIDLVDNAHRRTLTSKTLKSLITRSDVLETILQSDATPDEVLPLIHAAVKSGRGKLSRDVQAIIATDVIWSPKHLPDLLRMPLSSDLMLEILGSMGSYHQYSPELVARFRGTPQWTNYVEGLSEDNAKKADPKLYDEIYGAFGHDQATRQA